MRKSCLVGLVGLVVISCGGEAPPPQPPPQPTVAVTPPPPPPTETAAPAPPPAPKKPLAEMQQAAGKTLAEAFAAGDAKKVASVYADKAVWKMAGMPEVVGKDNIEKAVAGFFASFSKIKMGEQRVFVKKEVVVSEWVTNATHSGEFMGVKATEKPVGYVGASVMWFDDDGKVKEEHMYWNPAVVMFQIGASKDKNRGVPPLPASPQVITAQGTPAEDENVKTLHALNEAWEKKDEKKFLGFLTDKTEWDDITLPEPAKGKAAVQKYFKALSTAFPDAKLTTTNAWGMGDWVVEEGTYAGTNTGPIFGAPATKKSMTIHELNVVQLDKDHKVVKAVTYGNDLEMTTQLGLNQPPPGAKKDAAKPATPATPAKPDAAKPAAPATPAKPATPATPATPAPKK